MLAECICMDNSEITSKKRSTHTNYTNSRRCDKICMKVLKNSDLRIYWISLSNQYFNAARSNFWFPSTQLLYMYKKYKYVSGQWKSFLSIPPPPIRPKWPQTQVLLRERWAWAAIVRFSFDIINFHTTSWSTESCSHPGLEDDLKCTREGPLQITRSNSRRQKVKKKKKNIK